jgi:hypothetical protein
MEIVVAERTPPKRHRITSRTKYGVKPRVKKKKKKSTVKSISRLKKELEALQKQLVIKTYGKDCFTCPSKSLEGKNCQLGHVPWPRSVLSVQAKFDTTHTRIQCMPCNIHRGGMGAVALKRMQDEGIDTEAMWQKSLQERGKPVPRLWFEEQIQTYTSLLGK